MKVKFLQLRKVLLVATGLLVGASAWADDITSLPFSKTWTVAEEATSPFDAGTVIQGTNVTALNVNNTTATATFSIDGDAKTLEEGEEVTISFTAYHGWFSNGANQGVKLLNSEGKVLAEYIYNLGSCNITDVKIGEETVAGFVAFGAQSSNGTKGINGFTGNNNPYVNTEGYNPVITFKVVSDGSVTVNIKQKAHAANTYDNTYAGTIPEEWTLDIKSIQVYSGSDSSDRTMAINNLSVSSAVAQRAAYTVKYVDENDTEIDQAMTYSGVVGATPTLLDSDIAPRYNEDRTKKYLYASDDAASQTIAAEGNTVVTVKFKTASSYTYSVKGSMGLTIDTGTLFEDETKVVSWAKYIEYEGKWYVTNANYQTTVSNSNATVEVNYTETEITQYVEATAENWGTATENNAQYSEGVAYRGNSSAKAVITAEAAGIYTFKYAVCSSNTNADRTLAFYKNSAEDSNKLQDDLTVNWSYNYINTNGTKTIEKIRLSAGDQILLKPSDTNIILDYVALVKTGELEETGTIAESGYSTLASAFGLDFTNAEGIEAAYVVTEITKDAVILTEVTEVPANAGVILKGEGKASYSIPVKADATYTGTNLLKAAVTATEVSENEVYILQGGLFHLVTAASTVPAGKAYLLVEDVTSGARSLSLQFGDDDNTTGIVEVEKANTENSAVYNLNGQRVSKATNGLFIMNGKKVIIK